MQKDLRCFVFIFAVSRNDWLQDQSKQIYVCVCARDELIIHHQGYDYIYSNWWVTGEKKWPDVSVMAHNESPAQLLSACAAHCKVSRKQVCVFKRF